MLPPIPSLRDLEIQTTRLVLEPIQGSHAEEIRELYSDDGLHSFTPYVQMSIEKQRERCEKWERRISPTGDELWLNWLVRRKDGRATVGHIQFGIKEDGTAYVGYLISRAEQKKGYATESLTAALDFIREKMKVREVKACIDTRNENSIKLVRNLGFRQSEFIKDADFFRGATSDEFVYSIYFV